MARALSRRRLRGEGRPAAAQFGGRLTGLSTGGTGGNKGGPGGAVGGMRRTGGEWEASNSREQVPGG